MGWARGRAGVPALRLQARPQQGLPEAVVQAWTTGAGALTGALTETTGRGAGFGTVTAAAGTAGTTGAAGAGALPAGGAAARATLRVVGALAVDADPLRRGTTSEIAGTDSAAADPAAACTCWPSAASACS